MVIPSVVIIVPLVFAIAIPNIARGRHAADEAAAIGNLRNLISGLERYRTINSAYPASTEWRAMYPAGATSYGPPEFRLAHSLTNYPVHGHLYTYLATDQAHYTVRAIPAQVGGTSLSSFYVDESGLIRHCTPGPGGVRAGPTDRTISESPLPCEERIQ